MNWDRVLWEVSEAEVGTGSVTQWKVMLKALGSVHGIIPTPHTPKS